MRIKLSHRIVFDTQEEFNVTIILRIEFLKQNLDFSVYVFFMLTISILSPSLIFLYNYMATLYALDNNSYKKALINF